MWLGRVPLNFFKNIDLKTHSLCEFTFLKFIFLKTKKLMSSLNLFSFAVWTTYG